VQPDTLHDLRQLFEPLLQPPSPEEHPTLATPRPVPVPSPPGSAPGTSALSSATPSACTSPALSLLASLGVPWATPLPSRTPPRGAGVSSLGYTTGDPNNALEALEELS